MTASGESSADLVARIGNLHAAATAPDHTFIDWLNCAKALRISWPRIAELLTEAAAVQADNETLRGRLAMVYGPQWEKHVPLAASTPDTARGDVMGTETCKCDYGIRSLGRLYGIHMGYGRVRLTTHPGCPVHALCQHYTKVARAGTPNGRLLYCNVHGPRNCPDKTARET